jgi:hypothetical protein
VWFFLWPVLELLHCLVWNFHLLYFSRFAKMAAAAMLPTNYEVQSIVLSPNSTEFGVDLAGHLRNTGCPAFQLPCGAVDAANEAVWAFLRHLLLPAQLCGVLGSMSM